MKRVDFAHLHVHSDYSLLDGAASISALVDAARKSGMRELALTDHGNLFGAIQFYKIARSHGLKPIIGCEFYMAPGSRHERAARNGAAYHHLVLLSRDLQGYHNLIKLASYAYLEGFYYRPRIDRELLERYHEGLLATSACLSGEVARALLSGDGKRARAVAAYFKDLFGRENFYLELMNHRIDGQERICGPLHELSDELDVPLIATNDVHYLRRSDSRAHEALLCINTGKLLHDPNRMRMGSDEFYFKDYEEMLAAFPDDHRAVHNTRLVAEMCNLELSLGERHAPEFISPDGMRNEDHLRKLCIEGAARRCAGMTAEVKGRIEREVGVLSRMGYVSYFLIVWDFVRYAKEHGIPVGPGRGSGCGSLVAFLLGITDIDPLKYEILFERFTDEARGEPPDLDIDFCQERRDEVIDYVRRKYGAENVAQIITFGTMKARAVVRDVGRVLDIPLAKVDRIAKLVPEQIGITLEDAFREEPELPKLAGEDTEVAELFDIARRLEGISRHASTHAAGVVMADKPLIEYVPLCRMGEEISTQFDMDSVVEAGLHKMDFLGLKTLTVIRKAVDLVEETSDERIDIAQIPLDDAETFALLGRGETKGVFQCESSGFRELLQRLEPDCFEDMIVMVALYRPGPLQSGMVDDFIERKHGRKPVTFLSDALKGVLESTHGVMVYQDQVMRICHLVGGLPMNDAYSLIKAISKKRSEYIESRREAFVKGAVERGLKKGAATELFDLILKFGGYGFNKGHSTAYALIAYQTAWLKTHHPRQFMAAAMSMEIGNTDKVVNYIDECRRMGIEVLPPDINASEADFTVQGEAIRFALAAIKGVGRKAIETMIEGRRGVGRFTSLYHFCENVGLRAVTRSTVESFVRCGAFDSLGFRRAQLEAALERAIASAVERQHDLRVGQRGLFDAAGQSTGGEQLPDVPEWPEPTLLSYEKELLGLYLSSHPLARHEKLLNRYSTTATRRLAGLPQDAPVVLGGRIAQTRTHVTRRGRTPGERLGRLVIEDLEGTAEAILWPEVYHKYGPLVTADQIVFLKGKVDVKRDSPSIIVERVIPLERVELELTAAMRIHLSCAGLGEETLLALRDLLSAHPGSCIVYLDFEGMDRTHTLVRAGSEWSVSADPGFVDQLRDMFGVDQVELVGNGRRGNPGPPKRRVAPDAKG